MIKSVRNRLALWYGVLFSGLFLLAFYLIYHDLEKHLSNQANGQIIEKIKRNQWLGNDVPLEKIEKSIKFNQEVEGAKMVFYLLCDANGKIIAQSNLEQWGAIDIDVTKINMISKINSLEEGKEKLPEMDIFKVWHWKWTSVVFFETTESSIFPFRAGYVRLNNDKVLVLGVNMIKTNWFLGRLKQTFWILFATSVLLGGIIGFLLAGKAMSGVKRVTKTAFLAASGDLNKRVKIRQDGTEIVNLASTFNLMLDKIQALLHGLKQVSDDIAHDLRTPVTRIRSAAEMAATSTPDAECRSQMGIIVEECDRMVEMINTMLEIAQTDSGAFKVEMENVNVSEMLKSGYDLFQVIMEDKNIQHSIELDEDEIVTIGNKSRLQRVIANLLDNAIKFTPEGGEIKVIATQKDGHIIIHFRDTGSGIPLEEHERIFDRFYRRDPSRNIDGNGLGLCLARSIIRAHEGQILLHSEEGKGSCFTVILPTVSE